MYEKPKIAVWVAVYNEGEYLHQTISSILSQSYSNVDLIISNNHSTDKTNEIIQSFLDVGTSIILWSPPEHCPSMQHGDFMLAKLKQTGYDGFILVGGHDVIERTYVEKLVVAWLNHPNAAVVSGMDKILSRAGEIVGQYAGRTPQLINQIRYFNPFSILSGTNSNAAIHGLIPASIMQKVHVRYRCPAADVLFIAEISLHGDVIYVPDAIIQKRDTGFSENGYLKKHMSVEQNDSSERENMMNLQMRYVSDISNLALAGFPEELTNLYKTSLMSVFFLKWCTHDYVGGTLPMSEIVSSFISQINRVGKTIDAQLTASLGSEVVQKYSTELTDDKSEHFPDSNGHTLNAKEFASQIVNAAKGRLDVSEVTRAISEIEESVLDNFVASQFSGDKNNSIDVIVSDDVLNRLFERVQNQWSIVGEQEPYISVLSHEKFAMKNIAEHLVEFRDSGRDGIQQLIQLATKNNVDINFKQCLELGCGVGRMTAHFAKHFQKLLGADISPGNLKICAEYLRELEISNVDLKLLTKLSDLEDLPNYDVFVSFIAIQHNPPPIQRYILDKTLSKLNYGGVFFFQTIVHHPTYSYSAELHINSPPNPDLEAHLLPMRNVLQVISDHNLTLLDVIKDRQGGYGVDSDTFFGINLKAADKSIIS